MLFQLSTQVLQPLLEVALSSFQLGDDLRIFFAAQLEFLQLHVEFEDLFQQIGRDHLLFLLATVACGVGGRFGLLLQLHAFKAKEILRPRDGIFESAISVIEPRTLLQRPLLFLDAAIHVEIGMQFAAEPIKFSLECGQVKVELAGEAENGEVIAELGIRSSWGLRCHSKLKIQTKNNSPQKISPRIIPWCGGQTTERLRKGAAASAGAA